MHNNHNALYNDVAIIIPSRLGSTRLSNKPLIKIGDKTIIEWMFNLVSKTGLSNIFIATDSELIANVVKKFGGKVIMTDPSCPTGTDRVYAAFKLIPQNQQIKYVINVQGDMPFVKPETIINVAKTLKNSNFQIITPVTKVGIEVASGDSNVTVTVNKLNRAMYFSRSLIPFGASEFWYHVGIYGYHVEALAKFVSLPHCDLEQKEKLEQLRALDNGMDIGVCFADDVPISIDTKEDLDKAVKFYKENILSKELLHEN